MWAARDRDTEFTGLIHIFRSEPVLCCSTCWKSYDTIYSFEELSLNKEYFEWITFENSPVEFSCKPIFKK